MSWNCNLIVDSCCDLPHGLLDREEVHLIRFPFIDDDGEHVDDMYQSFTPKEFFDGMRHGNMPSTAQIPYANVQEAYDWAVASGKPTVFLCFSSGLSGTYDTMCLYADQYRAEHPDLELYVVDTKLASIAEGFLVFEAMRQLDQGMTAKELVAWAEEAQYFINCGFMVDDLNALRHGGRIPASVAFAGSKLDVKVLLAFDLHGSLSMIGVARGRKKGIRALADRYLKGHDKAADFQTVLVANADCPKDQERLKELIAKGGEGVAPIDCNIGPVIGSHVGPGMLAIVYWGDDRRKGASRGDRIADRVKGR